MAEQTPQPPSSESFNPQTDTRLKRLAGANLGWRWIAVGLIFALGLIAFAGGTALTERPGVMQAGLFVQTYYILGLFVVGGLDLGGGRSFFPHASGQYSRPEWQQKQAQRWGHTDHEVVKMADGEGVIIENGVMRHIS